MATKKKMLQAAAGQASGGAGEPGLDVNEVFSTYLYEGNGSSQVIENGINLGQSFGSGSGEFDGTSGMSSTTNTNILGSDFTVEAFVFLDSLTGSFQDIITFAGSPSSSLLINTSNQLEFYSYVTASSTFPAGQWVHVAFCKSGTSFKLFQDGSEVGSATDSTGIDSSAGVYIGSWTSVASEVWSGNISNLRVSDIARYSSSFTAPTSSLAVDSNTVLYLFNEDKSYDDLSSSGLAFTNTSGVDLVDFGPFDAAEAGEGGAIWFKKRSGNEDHNIYDTERGATKRIKPNTTDAENTQSNGLTSFNSDGWTMGSSGNMNQSGDTYASWTFRKAPKFFTCVQFSGTGPGSAVNEQQVSHDLGAKPGIVIIKRTDATGDWWVFTDVIDGSNDYGYLNQTAAFGNSGNNVATDSVFNVGGVLNTSGATYTAYLFAHNDGDGGFGPDGDQDIIKCGSLTVSSQATVDVNLGFEAQWVMLKRSDGTGNWFMFDVMRGLTVNGFEWLYANSSIAAEVKSYQSVFPTATGFSFNPVNNGQLTDGNYIYIAIRRGPLAPPESATEVFAPVIGSGVQSTGFPVDFLIGLNDRTSLQYYDPFVKTRLLGGAPYLVTSSTAAEASGSDVGFDTMDGLTYSWTSSSAVAWYWRRAPGHFDCLAYTASGNGTTISHNLGVEPELAIFKNRTTAGPDWVVHAPNLGTDGFLLLNSTNAVSTASNWYSATADQITFSTAYSGTATSGDNYIAYLFASLDGISKVGSFSHVNGTPTNVDCGFSSGARFVLWKSTSYANGWAVFDTVRGIVAGNDPYLSLNNTNAEETSYDIIDPTSSGFQMTGVMATGDYIFYAIA